MAVGKSLRSSFQITIEMFAPPFRQFADGEAIGFGRGRIDNFCVYHRIEGLTRAPLDTEYFDFIEGLSRSHSAKMVYRRFVTLYEFVKKEVSEEAIQLIDKLSSDFPKEYRACQTYFTILYLAMVAEENYPGTKLGKRLKRLGVHQILIEGMEVDSAANWSRGRPWLEIADECERRGF
jgi:hypothetical protein